MPSQSSQDNSMIGPVVPMPQYQECVNNFYIPLAPLITARYVNNRTEILTRVSLLVDTRVNKVGLVNTLVVNKNILSYCFQYEQCNEAMPTEVGIWYFELIHLATNIEMVQVNLQDYDPETSRGTVTTVQES
jgi:hypothetical protein